ncbi:MAG TPA: GTP-binding protein, partial [Desulfurivibrionaceae bacterium]|nr:GTP-binding protein [Desulfurivibrionaceae bacterium]
LLFTAGKTTRLGKVDDGSSSMDFEPEEISHHMTISSSFNQCSWKKHAIFLIDTPGDDNFLNESKFAAAFADTAIFVIEATGGLKSSTEKIAGFFKERLLPTIIVVNRMDRERADFNRALAEATGGLPFKIAPVLIPIGAEENFRGVVDIVGQKAHIFSGNTGKTQEEPIPGELVDQVAKARETLMEVVAETDDELIEKFLEEGELTDQELQSGLRKAVRTGAIALAMPMAATRNLGSAALLDLICDFLPNPSERPATIGTDPKTGEPVERLPLPDQPFSAQVFKTMADPYAGRLTIFKVISGTLKGDSFYNSSRDTSEKYGQLLALEGKNQVPTDGAGPGMILAVAKLKETVTGDTLCNGGAPVLFDRLVPIDTAISYAVTTGQK